MKNLMHYFTIIFIAFVSIFLTSCQNDGDTAENYAWMNTSIRAEASTDLDSSRIVDIAPDNFKSPQAKIRHSARLVKAREGLVATGMAFLSNDICVISYHGQSGANTGAIELVKCNVDGFLGFLSGVDFEGRVNNVVTDGNNRIFAALDTKNGPVLIALEVVDGQCVVKENIAGIRLNGVSVNGLLYAEENGVSYIYSASGGSGIENPNLTDTVMHFDGKTEVTQSLFLAKPGFQKTRVDHLTLSPVVFQGNENNRGKWIAKDGESMLTMHFSTYNNYTHAAVQYYPNGITSFHNRAFSQVDIATQIQTAFAKNVCLLQSSPSEPTYKYLYVCAGDKGFRSFRLDVNNLEAKFAPLSQIDVTAYGVADGGDGKLYLACGGAGIKVLNNVAGELSPYKFYKYDTSASANFIVNHGPMLYVAYGSEGSISIDKTDVAFQDGLGQ